MISYDFHVPLITFSLFLFRDTSNMAGQSVQLTDMHTRVCSIYNKGQISKVGGTNIVQSIP